MISYRLHLLLAIQRARESGHDAFADAICELLRGEQRNVYGVLHPMRADREAFSNVESPKLKIA